MLDPNLRREIQDEIRQTLMVILPALTGSKTTSQTETIDQLYPGMPEIADRPIMHPYGVVSRAPKGTNSIAARIGEHTSNRMIIGHMDNARKDISLNEGEVVLYNEFGQQIRLEQDKINLGKSADEPAVLGNVLVELLGEIMDILINGNSVLTTTPGNPSAPNPLVASQLTAFKSQYLTTATTNILSQETFVERKAP